MIILLTGGNGMVGRNILEHPLAKEHTIWSPSSKEVNLLDIQQLRWYVSSTMPDIIIHAAGRVGGIQANINAPADFLSDNLTMGLNLLNVAKEYHVPRVLNLSSSCVYPCNIDESLQESMILTGKLEPTNEGYALAKLAVQRLAEFITKQHRLEYKTLIPCNLYGRWDNFDPTSSHMLPAIIRKIHEAKINNEPTVDIWGDGEARREFMYAGDLADCILRAVDEFDLLPTITNIGWGYDHTVNTYYNIAAERLGYEGRFVHDESKPSGTKRKVLSVSNQQEWGWAPQTYLDDGIEKTYQFFLKEHCENS